MKKNDMAIETALRTLLALYTEEQALNSKREIDNDYLIQNLSSIVYSNRFITSYDVKDLLKELRKHIELIRDFSNPNRILDVMNFLAVKDKLMALIKYRIVLKNDDQAKYLLLKLLKDFTNIENSTVYFSKDFNSSNIFNVLMGYILIKETNRNVTLEDFIQMEAVKQGDIKPRLLTDLDSILDYFEFLDIKPLEDTRILYRNFDKSTYIDKLSIRNRYKVRKISKN